MTYNVPSSNLVHYKGPRVVTPPAADIVAAVRRGQSYAELSAIHNVSVSTLRRRVEDSGLGHRRRRSPTAAPIGDDAPAWMADGLCAQTDPEVFFPEPGGSPKDAKQTCRGCDVRVACLAYALDHDERFGVWGGTTPIERKKLRKDADS